MILIVIYANTLLIWAAEEQIFHSAQMDQVKPKQVLWQTVKTQMKCSIMLKKLTDQDLHCFSSNLEISLCESDLYSLAKNSK